MQSWGRALSSLRAACTTSGRTASSRTLSDAARPALTEGTAEAEGAKATLHRLLAGAEAPLTTAEVWTLAQAEGLKSKRFLKQMLLQMRRRGHVRAVPLPAVKKQKQQFGFLLPSLPEEVAGAAGAGE